MYAKIKYFIENAVCKIFAMTSGIFVFSDKKTILTVRKFINRSHAIHIFILSQSL